MVGGYVMRIGIYMLKNIKTDQVYIGSSMYLNRRNNDHFNMLSKNIHTNQILQESYNKYGKDNFKFIILEEFKNIDKQKLLELETNYINDNLDKCFNIMHEADLIKYNKKRKMTKELRKKISNANKEFYKNNPEMIEYLRNISTGKKLSNETKQKISEHSKNRWQDESYRKTIIEKNTGKIISDETKKKMSQAKLGKKASKETILKMKKAAKIRSIGRKHSEETKAKMRLKALARKRNNNGTFIGGINGNKANNRATEMGNS